MLKSLRKEISNDYKNLKLDSQREEFLKTISYMINKTNLPDKQANMVYKHIRRYYSLCNVDFNKRFEKSFERVNNYLNSGGKYDSEIDEMLNFIDDSFIEVYYGKKAYKIYKNLDDTNKKDKFYEGLKSIEENKFINSDEMSRRKEKYINSYFENLKLTKR